MADGSTRWWGMLGTETDQAEVARLCRSCSGIHSTSFPTCSVP